MNKKIHIEIKENSLFIENLDDTKKDDILNYVIDTTEGKDLEINEEGTCILWI